MFDLSTKDSVVIVLAVVTAIVGLIAAYYWFEASRVPIAPDWASDPNLIEPVEPEGRQMSWTVATMDAYQRGGRLNAIAARWTSVAVFLGMVTTIVGIIPGR